MDSETENIASTGEIASIIGGNTSDQKVGGEKSAVR